MECDHAEIPEEVETVIQRLSQTVAKELVGDLQCSQCGSMLYEPWTLGSGRSVCNSCVIRVTGEHVSPVANRLLDAIVQKCLPQSAEAAARRREGNDYFKQGQWQKAVEAYTAALQTDDTSSAALANRSIAQLKLKHFAEAIGDAKHAIALRPLWSKWHLRLAAALRANGQYADALVPLVRAVALEQATANSLYIGARVSIHGLQKSAKFNGMKGTCNRFENDRWEVRLQGGQAIKVKCVNLQVLDKVVDPKARSEIIELINEGHILPSEESLVFPSPPALREVSFERVQELRDDFDCCLCSSLMCDPTVLPCGHCMCRDCVARLLDHALQTTPSCPLCRQDLIPLLRQVNLRAREMQRVGLRFAHGGAQLTVCQELERLFSRWFPKEYAERLTEIRPPEGEWVPIFVCSLSAPFIPTPLHIFEPRYRLMMRRAVESNQRFGMCLPNESGESFADVGTMLFIDRFEQLPDGRSMVGTKGVMRFSVIQRGMLDGYATALIKPFAEDIQGFPESANFHREALALHRGAQALFGALKKAQPELTTKLEHQLGPLPDMSSPTFDAHMSFYAAQVLAHLSNVESPELVFKQPEQQRWQLLLQKCAGFKPFGDALQADVEFDGDSPSSGAFRSRASSMTEADDADVNIDG